MKNEINEILDMIINNLKVIKHSILEETESDKELNYKIQITFDLALHSLCNLGSNIEIMQAMINKLKECKTNE